MINTSETKHNIHNKINENVKYLLKLSIIIEWIIIHGKALQEPLYRYDTVIM